VIYGGEVATSDGKVTRVPAAVTPRPAAPAVASPPATPAPAPAADAAPSAARPGTTRARDPYRAALAGRQAAIRGCFDAHAAEVTGTPEVALELALGAGGEVTRAVVAPAALARTALGGCLVDVARGVRFPGTGAPVAVSIPVKVRRR
jgi:hypothetical protein